MKTVRVIILDDSLFLRETLAQELERDISIKVVAKAATAVEARDKIVEFMPDVLISSVKLSGMSGIDFIKKMLPQHYLPVIMMSSDPALEGTARRANAVAFVAKPTRGDTSALDLFYRQIIARIKMITNGDQSIYDVQRYSSMLVAIGASTGGAEALDVVLSALPCVMPPIVIAQHMPPKFTAAFAARMNADCLLSVKEAEAGEVLLPGQAYIAPGGMHTRVKKSGSRFLITLSEHDRSGRACPSIDDLFHSVAEATNGHSIGVLLTGMGKDGAEGLKRMHDLGSATIGQDEESSVVYGMPKAAFENGSVDYQLPLDRVAAKIQMLLNNRLV